MIKSLKRQLELATRMLKGKSVKRIVKHREEEVLIEFIDGTRLFIDHKSEGLELSITEK